MHKGFLKTAAITGLLSVALGAFGAHRLKEMVSEHAVATFETAVRYQFYHVFALLAVAILYREFNSKTMTWAGRFFILGTVFFSGSLYCLTIVQGYVQPGYHWLVYITPLGGLCFMIGWLLMFIAFFRK